MYAMGIVDLIFAGNWYNVSKKLWIFNFNFSAYIYVLWQQLWCFNSALPQVWDFFFLLSLCPFCHIFVLMILTWYHEKLSAVIQHSI